MAKKYLDKNVYEASIERIEFALNHFDDFYVSFSGGKDSGVLINLVIDVAKKLNKLPVKTVFSDLECIYQKTVDYTKHIMELPEVEPYWLCFDEIDQNASSVFERYYRMWDESKKEKWIRPMPKENYVINIHNCPSEFKKYLKLDSIDDWSIEMIGEYFCDISGAKNICNFIGMRADESYGRHMAIKTQKNRNKINNHTYMTKNEATRTWTCLPIYDWCFPDIWKYYTLENKNYNIVYDDFLKIGIPESEMRTCFAFGEEQKKSLWMWSQIESETWEKLVNRVEGANFGKIYNHTNINRGKIKKPDNVTWKEYCNILLNNLPPLAKDNFTEKFEIVYNYHKKMYSEKEGIDFNLIECDSRKEAKNKVIETGLSIKYFFSYETLCGAIIKRDFVFKKYGFGYSNKMLKRVEEMQKKWKEI